MPHYLAVGRAGLGHRLTWLDTKNTHEKYRNTWLCADRQRGWYLRQSTYVLHNPTDISCGPCWFVYYMRACVYPPGSDPFYFNLLYFNFNFSNPTLFYSVTPSTFFHPSDSPKSHRSDLRQPRLAPLVAWGAKSGLTNPAASKTSFRSGQFLSSLLYACKSLAFSAKSSPAPSKTQGPRATFTRFFSFFFFSSFLLLSLLSKAAETACSFLTFPGNSPSPSFPAACFSAASPLRSDGLLPPSLPPPPSDPILSFQPVGSRDVDPPRKETRHLSALQGSTTGLPPPPSGLPRSPPSRHEELCGSTTFEAEIDLVIDCRGTGVPCRAGPNNYPPIRHACIDTKAVKPAQLFIN